MWHIIIGGQPKKKKKNGGKLVENRKKENGTNDLFSLLVKYIYGALLFGVCGQSNKLGATKRCGKMSKWETTLMRAVQEIQRRENFYLF